MSSSETPPQPIGTIAGEKLSPVMIKFYEVLLLFHHFIVVYSDSDRIVVVILADLLLGTFVFFELNLIVSAQIKEPTNTSLQIEA